MKKSPTPSRSLARQHAREIMKEDIQNAERLAWLEKLFKQSKMWPLVCIETVSGETRIEACNKYHGDAAGRYTGRTLVEAVDKAMAGRK